MTNIEIAKLEGWMTRLCDSLDALTDGVLEARDALCLIQEDIHALALALGALGALAESDQVTGARIREE